MQFFHKLVFPAGLATSVAAQDSAPQVETEKGTVEGIGLKGGVRAFLGIPYAAAPINDLRWRPPQLSTSWDGIRPAKAFGASCPQFPPPNNSLYSEGESNFNEDCLFLNIWTGGCGNREYDKRGKDVRSNSKRPVLVVLHFGAFQFGSSSNPIYSGEAMARQGLVLVSVNYRLGRLGFLAHPDLTAESGTQSSGNYGHMDQTAALHWIKQNIASFGGDPDNVTLMGVSAGGHSVHNLRVSPLAKGLFHKCIIASGPGFAHALSGFGNPANPSTLAAGEEAGVEVAKLLNATSINEMRNFPYEKILAVQLPRAAGNWSFDLLPAGAAISLSVFDSGYPVVDGHVMPQAPLDAFLDRNNPNLIDVPMLASNTGNEASGLPYLTSLNAYSIYLTDTFGELADEALQLYPASTDAEAKTASWQLLADQVFVWSTWTAARLQKQNLRSKAWYARFLREPPIPANADLIEHDYAGAFHTADILYALGTLDTRAWNWTKQDRDLSESMVEAWANFARNGDPNNDQRAWPPLGQEQDGPVRVWELMPRVEKSGPSPDRMAFWDRVNGVALGYEV